MLVLTVSGQDGARGVHGISLHCYVFRRIWLEFSSFMHSLSLHISFCLLLFYSIRFVSSLFPPLSFFGLLIQPLMPYSNLYLLFFHMVFQSIIIFPLNSLIFSSLFPSLCFCVYFLFVSRFFYLRSFYSLSASFLAVAVATFLPFYSLAPTVCST